MSSSATPATTRPGCRGSRASNIEPPPHGRPPVAGGAGHGRPPLQHRAGHQDPDRQGRGRALPVLLSGSRRPLEGPMTLLLVLAALAGTGGQRIRHDDLLTGGPAAVHYRARYRAPDG